MFTCPRRPERGVLSALGPAGTFLGAAGEESSAAASQVLTVTLVSTQPRWHGGEEQARLLVRGLRARGHRCHILARRGGALAARMEEEGFPVGTFSGNGRSPLAVWQIRRHLARLRPDVLHYNDSHAMYAAGLASLGLGVRLRVAARRVSFALRSARSYRLLCDRVVCVSRAAAQACRESGLAGRLIRVVHDGVDPSRVRSGSRERGRRGLGLAEDQAMLLTVASLTDCKGHTYLLKALARVLAKHPRACAVLAGDGHLADDLKAEARELGIESHVRFLGYRNDVPDLIQAADLCVLPSLTEGLCSTLIDVMLAARPIVTTTAGGIPELTGSDEAKAEPVAWSVPPGDPDALAAAIIDALDSPDRRTLLAESGRRRAERLFTADDMLEATLDVYRELLGGG